MLGNYSSSGNMIMVSDSNSLWKSASDLYIGKNAGAIGNRLIISNGGTVINATAYIGAAGAGNHAIVVTGSGSTWTNAGLSVGHYGSSNQY